MKHTPFNKSLIGLALEEVVVTARKRSENLQDVPMSISAFSSSDLQNAQIDNLV
jgi:iron complex outermembrane receptor protein